MSGVINRGLQNMDVDAKLTELGLHMPEVAAPLANYLGWVRTGDQVHISGQLSKNADGTVMAGHLGDTMMTEQGVIAARSCALYLLAQMKDAVGGDWSRLKRVVKLNGIVSSDPQYREHPIVVNGASDLLVEVLGDIGRHARCAIGVASLPLGAAVELEAIVEIA
jgi:enamine deaminase RidA (YjgF/YER057c/UK114 family)